MKNDLEALKAKPCGAGLLESLAAFALGAALMSYFYAGSVAVPGDEIGLPGHDSFYHVAMAAMIPERGVLREFPWLQYSFFTEEGNDFVSHHFGYHLLLASFVHLSHLLTGDYMAGGRWANCVFLGLNLVLFNLLLSHVGVRWRWVWLVLFVLMPDQFFTRHAFVRAIGPSLTLMLLLMLLLFQRRYLWAGVVVAGYIHLYLGAVMYVPVVVALYALAQAIGPKGDRRIAWRMTAFTAGGWLLGVLTYPYFDGMVEFLKMQVLGSGLSPDIEVGREWKPYTDPWWFVTMSGTLLVVWTATLCARVRLGARFSAEELALLMINFAFLCLTLKARRFIEYWPVLCLLSAAYMSAPLSSSVVAAFERVAGAPDTRRRLLLNIGLIVAGCCVVGGLMWRVLEQASARPLLAEWQAWAAVLSLFLLAPLVRTWLAVGGSAKQGIPLLRLAAVPVCAALFVAAIAGLALLGYRAGELPQARLSVGTFGWVALGALYLVVPVVVLAKRRAAVAGVVAPSGVRCKRGLAPRQAALTLTKRADDAVPVPFCNGLLRASGRSLALALTGVGAFGAVALAGSDNLTKISRTTRCRYDLPAIRDAMAYLKENSQPGDVVFTDDWDVFPVYLYNNSRNYYVVGLDPKFTHQRRPDLWKRYVKISRGQVPAKATLSRADAARLNHTSTFDIGLADIREHFGAKYVITDRDHKKLARKLAHDPALAEIVYPADDYEKCSDEPYLVFRIRAAGEPHVVAALPEADRDGNLYLSLLVPSTVDQGWGELANDSSVDGRRISVDGRSYGRGLGTHAPSKLVFDIPPGYDAFEAVVGVDDETDGRGSVVASVYVDGRQAYESPVLKGGARPAIIRIPLDNARQLLLRAEPTQDGNRHDHVDWANARLIRRRIDASQHSARADAKSEKIVSGAQ